MVQRTCPYLFDPGQSCRVHDLIGDLDIVEEVVVGKFKGKTFAESFPHVGDGSPRAFFYMMIVFAIALIPYFSFKEIGRVVGERELRSLFFAPAKRS
jgi:hypothetical protein